MAHFVSSKELVSKDVDFFFVHLVIDNDDIIDVEKEYHVLIYEQTLHFWDLLKAQIDKGFKEGLEPQRWRLLKAI